MVIGEISISPKLQSAHQRVLLRYLRDDLSLTHHDWVELTEAVDALSASVVMVNGQTRSFQQFYAVQIDQRFADAFLAQLLTFADAELEGRSVQAAVAREIRDLLNGLTGFNRDGQGGRLLLVYCYYWWSAFARGYIFELTIFRDLTASGIQFIAHDVANRHERLAPYDLLLLDMRGDIKYLTYFLTSERLSRLHSDFFLTRWYVSATRQWLRVALMRETAWQAFNSATTRANRQAVAFDAVTPVLPAAAVFVIDTHTLTALGYERWKELVLHQQTTGAQ